jgi:phosphohistidine phosphatase
MRRLMLLRHAKAVPLRELADEERPLSGRGREAVPAVGAFMARHALTPGLALVSPVLRARETWELLLPAWPKPPPHRIEPRLYAAPAELLRLLVRETPAEVQSLLLIGHNPGFEQFARAFAGSGEAEALARFANKMPTASLAVIDLALDDWKRVEPQCGRLERFVTPKSLGKTDE